MYYYIKSPLRVRMYLVFSLLRRFAREINNQIFNEPTINTICKEKK